MNNSEITNSSLRVYKEEYDRLVQERHRIELLTNAILTASAIDLETVQNNKRLDFTHLNNAYLAYKQGDTDSMAFKIMDTTIRDLFLQEEQYFKFEQIIYHDSECYEFIYNHPKVTICITVPSASRIDKDNVLKLNWGVITISEVTNISTTISEHTVICQSDDVNYLRSALANYLVLRKSDITMEVSSDE